MSSTTVSNGATNGPFVVSVLSFGTKGICAFMITYWLANSLTVDNFASWAIVFSFGMILSVADFGVGQLVLTTLHESDLAVAGDVKLMTQSVTAMALLSTLMLLLTSIVLLFHDFLGGIRWKYFIVFLILLRLIFIPFGAALSAHDRYHERKLIEAVSYALGAVFILWGVTRQADVSTLLLGMNLFITLGSVAMGVRAARLGVARVQLRSIAFSDIGRVFTDSLPYFINNVSGLAIYGGFIALSALVLTTNETAKVSLLHNLLFMNLFQAFELVFRTMQTRMHDEALMHRLRILMGLSYLGCVVSLALAGAWLFRSFFGRYEYTAGELVVYVSFVFLEIYYLLLTSRMQMNSSMKGTLQSMSLAKAAGFLVALLGVSTMRGDPTLMMFSLVLVVYSLSMAYWMTSSLAKRGAPYQSGIR